MVKLAALFLASSAQADDVSKFNKAVIDQLKTNTDYYRASEWSASSEPIVLSCGDIQKDNEQLDSVKWYRTYLNQESLDKTRKPILGEEKFLQQDRNEETGEMEVTVGSDLVDQGYQLVDGALQISPPAELGNTAPEGLTLAFICEADLKTENGDLVERDAQIHGLRFLKVAENPIEKVDPFGADNENEYINGDSTQMATCISGYFADGTEHPVDMSWTAVKQDGSRVKLPQAQSYIEGAILEDKKDGLSVNVADTIQFPYGNITLDASFDKAYFECEVKYDDAENKEKVEKTKSERHPSNGFIRVEHGMDNIEFTVDGTPVNSAGGKLIVQKGQEVDVECTPNGFKIGFPHQVSLTKGGEEFDGAAVFDDEEDLSCSASLEGSESLSKSVRVIPKAIGEVTATWHQYRSSDPYDVDVQISGDSNIALDDDDVIVQFYGKGGKLLEATKVEDQSDGSRAMYQLDSQPDKVVVSIKDSSLDQQANVDAEIGAGFRSTDTSFCKFEQYLENGADKVKMWYSNCDDESSLATVPESEFDRSASDNSIQGSIPEDQQKGGVYICCYDVKNDVSNDVNSLFGNSKADLCTENPYDFLTTNKLEKCSKTYKQVSTSSFPWWIILVLILIILVVIGACYFWNKKKQENENDLEVGNVEKIDGADGEIDATQEEQEELIGQKTEQQTQQQTQQSS